MIFCKMLLLLFAGHALCDFPAQGDYLAKGKNPFDPLPGTPWYQCLLAHCLIHAGMVTLITGSFFLGLAEFCLHWYVDYCKCEGTLSFDEDQAMHYLCKIAWAILAVYFKVP